MKNIYDRVKKTLIKKKHSPRNPKIIWISGGVFLVFALTALGGYIYFNKVVLNAETNLRFGFVTDFEYGYKDNVGNKLSKIAPKELEKVVDCYNNEFHPEVVISGGDMVESSLSKKNTTIKQFQEINEIFSRIQSKKGYIFGNHDLRDLSKEELRNILGMSGNHSYSDQGDWRFVLMDTNYNKDGSDKGPDYYVEGYVPESEFEWLREAFNTERPIILFSHHSPMPIKTNGALVFNLKNIANASEVHNFLKGYENLVLVLSGHDPNFVFNEIDGINYLIVDNLANKDSIGSFASIEARYNSLTRETSLLIEHHGPLYNKLEVKKKTGDFNIKRLFADFNF